MTSADDNNAARTSGARAIDRATELYEEFRAHGRREDLDASVALLHEALSSLSPNSFAWVSGQNNLALVLRHRYALEHQKDDLDAAISACRAALTGTVVGSDLWISRQATLALLLKDRLRLAAIRAEPGLDAVAVCREVLEHLTAASPNWLRWREFLGSSLHDRYDAFGHLEDLDEAAVHFEAVTQAAPTGSADWIDAELALSDIRLARFEESGGPHELTAAIAACREVLQITDLAVDSAAWGRAQATLASALRARFEADGNPNDLAGAIGALRLALDRPGYTPLEQSYRRNNLGLTLVARYHVFGEMKDLDDAVAMYESALSTAGPDTTDWVWLQANMGNALRTRAEARNSELDLEAAIVALRKAVGATRSHWRLHARYEVNLANALRARYEVGNRPEDLADAITALKSALESSDKRAPYWTDWRANLGSALLAAGQVDDAVDAFRDAVAGTRQGTPDRARWQINLGQALRARFEQLGRSADLRAARVAYRAALDVAESPAIWASLRLIALRGLGDLEFALGRWKPASEALEKAVEATNVLYRAQALTGAGQAWLAQSADTYRRAGYALARAGRLAAAVAAFEQGRARGLRDALARDRMELDQVRQTDQRAFDTYAAASAAVLRASEGAVREQARRAHRDLDVAIDRISTLGQSNLFAEPTFEDVARGVQPGVPIAYIVTTSAGSLVLVISRRAFDEPSEIVPLWVHTLQTEGIIRSLLGPGGDDGGYLGGQLFGGQRLVDALADILPVLGNQLVAPLAAHLRQLAATGVVLVPGASLGLLPLHAAPYPLNGGTVSLIDELEVTFSPSVGALAAASAALQARPNQSATLVAVANPLGGVQRLEFAHAEVEMVGSFFDAADTRIHDQETATKRSFLKELPNATHVHLACHGRFDLDDPLESGLNLSGTTERLDVDGWLTLGEILSGGAFRNIRLVVLSACQTALAEFSWVPDEVVGLPAGLLQAGALGVVGSLWLVADLSTAVLMRKFYELHILGDTTTREPPMAPSRALARAQRWLRDATAAELRLIEHWSERLAASAGRDTEALRALRHYRRYPDERPFSNFYYWAPFVCVGV